MQHNSSLVTVNNKDDLNTFSWKLYDRNSGWVIKKKRQRGGKGKACIVNIIFPLFLSLLEWKKILFLWMVCHFFSLEFKLNAVSIYIELFCLSIIFVGWKLIFCRNEFNFPWLVADVSLGSLVTMIYLLITQGLLKGTLLPISVSGFLFESFSQQKHTLFLPKMSRGSSSVLNAYFIQWIFVWFSYSFLFVVGEIHNTAVSLLWFLFLQFVYLSSFNSWT